MTKEASQKRHVHDECGSSIVAEKKRAEGEQKRVLSIRRSFSEKGGMRELSGDERTKVRTLRVGYGYGCQFRSAKASSFHGACTKPPTALLSNSFHFHSKVCTSHQ